MTMAHTVHHPAILRRPAGFTHAVAAAFRRFVEWQNARTAMRQLSHMSDAMLNDIGITRDEIPGAVRHGRPGTLTIPPHEGAFR